MENFEPKKVRRFKKKRRKENKPRKKRGRKPRVMNGLIYKETFPEKGDIYYQLSSILLKSFRAGGKVKYKRTSLKKWARFLHLLHIWDENSLEEIQETVEWYSKHWKLQFIPVVRSTNGFRQKYDRIRDAMERVPTITEEAVKLNHKIFPHFLDDRREDHRTQLRVQKALNEFEKFRDRWNDFDPPSHLQEIHDQVPNRIDMDMEAYIGEVMKMGPQFHVFINSHHFQKYCRSVFGGKWRLYWKEFKKDTKWDED